MFVRIMFVAPLRHADGTLATAEPERGLSETGKRFVGDQTEVCRRPGRGLSETGKRFVGDQEEFCRK